MNNNEYLIKYYVPMVDFLADVMGGNTEVVLHDVNDLDRSIIAIRNGHVSGRKVGGPTTNLVLKVLKTGAESKTNYVSNYVSKSKNNKNIMSSSYFIKREDEIIGIMCINRDVTEFSDLKNIVDSLMNIYLPSNDKHPQQDISETLTNSTYEIVMNELTSMIEFKDKLSLSQQEKISIISHLQEKGIFLLKGAVKEVADALGISEQSVYRYIKMI